MRKVVRACAKTRESVLEFVRVFLLCTSQSRTESPVTRTDRGFAPPRSACAADEARKVENFTKSRKRAAVCKEMAQTGTRIRIGQRERRTLHFVNRFYAQFVFSLAPLYFS